ncbi:MAG TPA: hypothetical protein VE974_10660 [Thermoanaerobaculia bacterium]|nr:hypothetical protein [Thermoanaerobaculia bacterium]
MVKLRDLYTKHITAAITSDDTRMGQAILQYEVHRYVDTRNLTEATSYLVTCTQRLTVPNRAHDIPATAPVQEYRDYPALLISRITVNNPGNPGDPNDPDPPTLLVDYSPRTLNTSVNTAVNSSAGSSTGTSQQYTSGSSTAQTNTFGWSESAGFFGEMFTPSVSHDSSTSTTTEQSEAASSGRSVDTNSELAGSSAMAIKDWGSYAQLDISDPNVSWIWGQEYPWNVLQFNAPANTTDSAVLLPTFVQQRLLDNSDPSDPVLNPPSELALLGVDFVSKATWLITPRTATVASHTISFTHDLSVSQGTHSMQGGQVTALLRTAAVDTMQSGDIDLPLYALDPLSAPSVIGFVPDQFIVAPAPDNQGNFAIVADANDLLVRGLGFTSVMATDFSAGPVQMTVYFKVTEPNTDINLSLKNWIVGTVPCQLTIEINGYSTLLRYVDAPETSGGSDNITVVALRYKNFTSVNYCDYLKMGLNQVSITIAPTSTPGSSYQLLAIAVG